MKRFKNSFWFVPVVFFSLCMLVYFAWSLNTVSGTWRYRMTVSVQTPEGIKTGSSVWEVSNSASKIKILDLPEGSNPAKVRGEAIVVDLGSRGKLFAILAGSRSFYNYPDMLLYELFDGGTSASLIGNLNKVEVGRKAVLSPADYPVLVMFKDINDPKSVEKIDLQDAEANWGRDITLKEITVEITKDKVTWGVVDKFLPENFKEEITDRWHELSIQERQRLYKLTRFKLGG